MLIDSVQAARFLTAKKADGLITKLSAQCSAYQAKALRRNLFLSGRVRNMNDSIYASVDQIHGAIDADAEISFKYQSYSVREKTVHRREGEVYRASPFALVCDKDNYYLLAYSPKDETLRHFRVDKMEEITLIPGEPRRGKAAFAALNLAKYVDSQFSMFAGKPASARLRFSASLLPVFADRFGDTMLIEKEEGGEITATVRVAVSPQFYGWLFGLSVPVAILSPEWVRQGLREKLQTALNENGRAE
jgi:predicted DNA-binding transcriptional regulator YafY